MNANELADELESYQEIPVEKVWVSAAAIMLRTIPALEAEIEALEAKLEEAEDQYCQLLNGEDY